jgi:hypothetical protein
VQNLRRYCSMKIAGIQTTLKNFVRALIAAAQQCKQRFKSSCDSQDSDYKYDEPATCVPQVTRLKCDTASIIHSTARAFHVLTGNLRARIPIAVSEFSYSKTVFQSYVNANKHCIKQYFTYSQYHIQITQECCNNDIMRWPTSEAQQICRGQVRQRSHVQIDACLATRS